MNDRSMFRDWLKRLRASLDITQDMLAEQVGCSVDMIRGVETGRRRPSRAMIERMADVLQVPQPQREAFFHAARVGSERPTELNQDIQPIARNTPLITPPPRATRLPIPPTALIGRAAEEAEVQRRLLDPECRLLTLIGAGGTGKTRLALQTAANVGAHFNDGANFVALAPIISAELVAAAIADVLGCPLSPTQTTEESLLHFLRDRNLLLVLDNLEHLLAATPLLVAILREAPDVRLLVTSRERLRLHGEWIFELGGLSIPADDSRAAIERSDAVLLFLHRARQVAGDFSLTPANRTAIAHICRLLDGMPLGLELAAAWVRALTIDEIGAELRRGLDFLAVSDRDADPRHRSMRAVIDHSWSLLTADEQRVMARMSIFRGGSTREAAEAVAGGKLPVMLALLDKSLLRRTAAGRYEMHELVRQYAADQLSADPQEYAATQREHAAYFVEWINSRERPLKSPRQHEIVAEITTEIDNIRAAWQYAVDYRQIKAFHQISQGSALAWFYELRSWYEEGERSLRLAAQALQTPPPANRDDELLLGSMMGNQGWYMARGGRPEEGLKLLETAVAVLRGGHHTTSLFFALEQLSYLLFLGGDFDRSVLLQEEAVALAQQIDDPWIKAHAAFIRAAIYTDRAPDIAYARFHEGLPHIRTVGDRYHLILTLFHAGEIALALGKVAEAEQAFTEALERSIEVGNGVGEVLARCGLAQIGCARGAWAEARALSLEAVALSRKVSELSGQAKALTTLGEAHVGSGAHQAARQSFSEAINVSLEARAMPAAIHAWLALAALDIQHPLRAPKLRTLLSLIRRHTATSRVDAARAEQLWHEASTHADAQAIDDLSHNIALDAPDQLVKLLNAYIAETTPTMMFSSRVSSPS